MQKEELQKFCVEKNILLDSSLQELFILFPEEEFIKNLIEKIKIITNKRFLNKSLIKANQNFILKFVDDFPFSGEVDLRSFKKRIGLNENVIEEKVIVEDKSSDVKVKVKSSFPSMGKKLEVKDFVNYFRGRYNSFKEIMQERGELENLVSIGKIPDERQKVSIIGMVSKKKITKNKNVLLDIEDLTGRIKVLISA